ncbi:melanoma-associated antigen 10-like [Cavia porcellus]|uniref:melanoma-associated antigen 10-like n=1 Tax=Cavia porcellus TaxID=10141 RepID=UPI00022B24BE|nr:melanoma-associated antigen 10-like [Cavia porcellus]XP_003461433.1 melanoma-associated antigen 10-like [Cavia porcellus]
MSHSRKRRCFMLEADPEAQDDNQGHADTRVPVPVEEEEDSSLSSSNCSSSFPSSSHTSFSSSSFSGSPPHLSSSEEDDTAAGDPVSPESPLGAYASLPAMVSAPWSSSDACSVSSPCGGVNACQVLPGYQILPSGEGDNRVTNLVNLLLFKYRMKELVTEAEILNVIQNYSDYAAIFSEVYECMQLVFGIELKDVEPSNHAYVLVSVLGISYDGMLSEVQGVPKTGLLVLLLCTIFLRGGRVPAEDIWHMLNVMGIWSGATHFIYADPRNLILGDFLQEQYLVYQQVPNSCPARYEFLWGPRVCAETSKMKIIEFLASLSGSDPKSFGARYEEALREEEERMQATIATSAALASASSSASCSFSSTE